MQPFYLWPRLASPSGAPDKRPLAYSTECPARCLLCVLGYLSIIRNANALLLPSGDIYPQIGSATRREPGSFLVTLKRSLSPEATKHPPFPFQKKECLEFHRRPCRWRVLGYVLVASKRHSPTAWCETRRGWPGRVGRGGIRPDGISPARRASLARGATWCHTVPHVVRTVGLGRPARAAEINAIS